MVPAAPAAIAETTVQTGDTAVKSPAMEGIAVKSAKSGTVESALTVKTSSATVRCLGEVGLAQQSRAQQSSRDARCTPPFLWQGSIG